MVDRTNNGLSTNHKQSLAPSCRPCKCKQIREDRELGHRLTCLGIRPYLLIDVYPGVLAWASHAVPIHATDHPHNWNKRD
eukprot:scaffold153_cov347-Pavlova_lutheri.AAC.8